jgi:hypothetical protein
MDERPDQIIGHIEAQRDELGRNLNELETRVRRSTDWRTYYDRNPMLMLGAALGGGLLLGSMVGTKTSHRSGYSGKSRSRSSSALSTSAMGLASAGAGVSAASTWSKPTAASHSSHGMSEKWGEVSETLDHIKTALVSFGVAKAKEFLSQAIPGIDHHLSEAERKRHGQHHDQSWQHGSTSDAQRYEDSGAFAHESGGTQSTGSPNWESDIYRSSGQFGSEGSRTGSSDYYSGTTGETGRREHPQSTPSY